MISVFDNFIIIQIAEVEEETGAEDKAVGEVANGAAQEINRMDETIIRMDVTLMAGINRTVAIVTAMFLQVHILIGEVLIDGSTGKLFFNNCQICIYSSI